MLSRPQSIVAAYQRFSPMEIDGRNLIEACVAGARMARLSAHEVEMVLAAGPMAAETQEILGRWAVRTQARCLWARRYAHNLKVAQATTLRDRRSLGLAGRHPRTLEALAPRHGDLVVVDASLSVDVSEGVPWFWLADYPFVVARTSDPHLPLVMADDIAKRLADHPLLAPGWHPYCRVLGRFVTRAVPTQHLQVLMVSLRALGPVVDATIVACLAEWEEIKTPAFGQSDARKTVIDRLDLLQRLNRLQIPDDILRGGDASGDAVAELRRDWSTGHDLDRISSFEDDIFSGPMGFWLGLLYVLETAPAIAQPGVAAVLRRSMQQAVEPFSNPEWASMLTSLERFGLVRFTAETWSRMPLKVPRAD